MEDFTTLDRLKLTLNPVLCCFASSSNETTTNSSDQNWFTQSRPSPLHSSSNRKGKGRSLRGNWDDESERLDRREEDLLSLHENRFNEERSDEDERSSRNSQDAENGIRRKGKGKQISASELNEEGSQSRMGLSRWNLFKSWWNSKSTGMIRLEEEEVDDTFTTSPHRVHQFHTGEEDAFVLEEGNEPFIDSEEEEAQRLEQKAIRKSLRKEKRRRARELGLTTEEFDEGQSGILEEDHSIQAHLTTSHYQPTHSKSRSSRSSNSTQTTETTDFVLLSETQASQGNQNGSHGFNFSQVAAPLVEEELEDLFGIPRPLVKARMGSNGSGSGNGSKSRLRSESNGSSNSKKSRKEIPSIPYNFRDFLSPNPIDSPPDTNISPTPSTESVYPLVTQPILKPFLPKKTSHKSTHSTSTTSTGRGRNSRGNAIVEEDLFSNGSENAVTKRWSGMEFNREAVEEGGEEMVDVYVHIGKLPGTM